MYYKCLLTIFSQPQWYIQGHCPPNGGICRRCLPFFVANAAEPAGVTREQCACLCSQHGYTLAGVENANNCYCGHTINATTCGGAPIAEQCTKHCANGEAGCGNAYQVDIYDFKCESASSSSCSPPPPSPPPPPPPPPPSSLFPRVHYTPKCFVGQGGAHDIAAALYHSPTKIWHVMAGCWSKGGCKYVRIWAAYYSLCGALAAVSCFLASIFPSSCVSSFLRLVRFYGAWVGILQLFGIVYHQ